MDAPNQLFQLIELEPGVFGKRPVALPAAAPPKSGREYTAAELRAMDRAIRQRQRTQPQQQALRQRAADGDPIARLALATTFRRNAVKLS